jgi:hypothetical protein
MLLKPIGRFKKDLSISFLSQLITQNILKHFFYRLNELMQGDGLAIIDSGLNFGGGILGRYGINSNTSGGGFLKCAYKKVKKEKAKEIDHTTQINGGMATKED